METSSDCLTLEQVQRAVLEATRNCTQHFEDADGKGCPFCNDTGRVLMFPQAGERCPGLGYADHEDDPSRCRFCAGYQCIPTINLGRLLEAVRGAGLILLSQKVTSALEDYLLAALDATELIEAIWWAMYGMVQRV